MVSNNQFALFGNLGFKVFDTIKALQSNYEAWDFFTSNHSLPDLDQHVFTTDFRRERAEEVLKYLLHRDHSDSYLLLILDE